MMMMKMLLTVAVAQSRLLVLLVVLLAVHGQVDSAAQCTTVKNNDRLDCYPQDGANSLVCQKRGCCWAPPFSSSPLEEVPLDVPYCFYPSNYAQYVVTAYAETAGGLKATLKRTNATYLPGEILNLQLQVIFHSANTLRVRITDPVRARFEVPITLSPADKAPPSQRNYSISVSRSGPLTMTITRRSDGAILFQSLSPLLYANQFIQLSFRVPAATSGAYGIGEQNTPLLHNLDWGWTRMGFWARDNPIGDNINLYGTHPFMLGLAKNGSAFGVFFFNSNAQEFGTQPGKIVTYRTIGGILDMYLFTGDSPAAAVTQYQTLIGLPQLPPFWALGFHLSRYGHKNMSAVNKTLMRNLEAGIPIEVQWSDIDYMDHYRDFTVDGVNYADMGKTVAQIKQKYGVRYVVILDPAISNQNPGSYPPYDEGLAMGVFVRDVRTGQPLVGKVWPGNTVYPDFSHPNCSAYWSTQVARLLARVPVDGLWIDMNEPSNFYDGSLNGCPPSNSLDNPPFVPHIRDNSLVKKTVCASALHYNKEPHYNLHNLYGYQEAVATAAALRTVYRGRRTFVLSRSTFAGSGRHTAHWTGDNSANWQQMANSVRQILNFNMFGIPFVGADICGFIDHTTEELCIRWMQLGAFYPFMRNHNDRSAPDQDPAAWSTDAQKAMKTAIMIRYTLLGHLYSLLVHSSLHGTTVARPLSFEFPDDTRTHRIEGQFLLGSSLIVMPICTQGARSFVAYFPEGTWYDLTNVTLITRSSKAGSQVTLPAPLDKINVAVRGGSILPMLIPQMNTDKMRQVAQSSQGGIILYYALRSPGENGSASGRLYWDDGVSDASYSSPSPLYSLIEFAGTANDLTTLPIITKFAQTPQLSSLLVIGLPPKATVNKVTVNGVVTPNFAVSRSSLTVQKINLSLLHPVKIQWQ